MTAGLGGPGHSAVRAWSLVLLPWTLGLAALAMLPASAPAGGLLFVVLGVTAATLITFDAREWPGAVRWSPTFWEGVARNAWAVGALASVLFFGRALGDSSATIAGVARGLALAFLPALFGLILAVLAAVPALRLRSETPEGLEDQLPAGAGRYLGVLMLLGLLGWTLARPPAGDAWRFAPHALLLQPSAALTVAGAALLFVALSGSSLRRRVGVVACGLSAAVCAPAGLVLALLGIADQNIGRVVSGLGFVLTSSVVSLAALLAVANPVEDRRLRRGEDPMPLNRTVWILLPGVALVLLLIVLGFAMTPMEAPAASRAEPRLSLHASTPCHPTIHGAADGARARPRG